MTQQAWETVPPPAGGSVTWPLDNSSAAAGDDAVTLDVTGDTQLRYLLEHDGKQWWGSGSAVGDISVGRVAANELDIRGTALSTILRISNIGHGNNVRMGNFNPGNFHFTIDAGEGISLDGSGIGVRIIDNVGFYNTAPVAQGAAVADAAGGAIIDAEARVALNALLARIRAVGLIVP